MSDRAPALSPSRAADFKQCPLLYRYRAIDRMPEPPSAAATLGTLVHAVLEDLFALPAASRTEAAALEMVLPRWLGMVQERPELASLHPSDAAEAQWLGDARERVRTYFEMENPTRIEPDGRELLVEVQLEDGPLLRGIIDRVDVAADGSLRIVDYKSGRSPAPQYSGAAKFQMKFYALVVERLRERRPALTRLLYLRDGVHIDLRPSDEDMAAVEHEVREVWRDITSAAQTGEFRTKRSKLCSWCSFQALCPEFGGVTPPLDADAVEAAVGVRPLLQAQ
jgi:putative RecB family exonuclease